LLPCPVPEPIAEKLLYIPAFDVAVWSVAEPYGEILIDVHGIRKRFSDVNELLESTG